MTAPEEKYAQSIARFALTERSVRSAVRFAQMVVVFAIVTTLSLCAAWWRLSVLSRRMDALHEQLCVQGAPR